MTAAIGAPQVNPFTIPARNSGASASLRVVEKGLLPNYTHRLVDIEKQYNTIGITAMYEVMVEFGYIDTDEFGNKSYTEEGLRFASEIMDLINKQKEEYDFNYSINVECVPKRFTGHEAA